MAAHDPHDQPVAALRRAKTGSGCCLSHKLPFETKCLTCPSFVTRPQFLPAHRKHLSRVEAALGQAKKRGQQAHIEENRQARVSLLRIIRSLEKLAADERGH